MTFAHVTGWGMAVPEKVMTNDDLAQIVETSDEWIRTRTGIRERRIASPEDSTATLGAQAALEALSVARVKPTEVDLIICATSTPEHIFPATAALIQNAIGATNAGAFDLSAACSGFIFALNLASQSIRTGAIKTALIIGAETLSRFVNWEDRNTCVLFGDGAGAMVLQASELPGGVYDGVIRSDGSGADLLTLPAGGSRRPASAETVASGEHFIHMDGREVFRFATRVMARATKEVLALNKWEIDDLTWVAPHQANLRIIEAAARALKLPSERFIVNLDRYGNTSTASIPIAITEAVREGKIKPGDKMVLVGFGAGLTWGAVGLEWVGAPDEEGHFTLRPYLWWARLHAWYQRAVRFIEGLLWGR